MQSNLLAQSKEWLIPAYYYATLPLRYLASSLANRTGMQPIATLFYHRVADSSPCPWTISNREFERQIDWLTCNFEVISLAECQRRIQERANHRPAACITFDDGYADNCEQALPLLIARRIPCTYFVTTDFVRTGAPFPHDVARGTPLAPNTLDQLRSLTAAGVEIGAHTRTHRDLGTTSDRKVLEDEILGSRDDLEGWLGCRVRYFAFPFGKRANLSAAAFQIAKFAGLAGACSACGTYNIPGDDPFHIQRLHADTHFPRFKNWLTFEPRLLARVRQFDYENLGTAAAANQS